MKESLQLYVNTNVFNELIKEKELPLTSDPARAEVLVLGAKKVNYPEFMNLQAVYRFGVGTDNIDFDYLRQRQIAIHMPSEETKAVLFDATADFAVYAILFDCYRGAFGEYSSWKKKARGHLAKKRALVIGTGNIGCRVVQKLSPFMSVATYDVSVNTPREFEALVREADIITVHTPLTSSTRNMFNDEVLDWVKDGALLVNTARGDIFNEDALYKKLNTTNCRAFFDVFWQEPYNGKLATLGEPKFTMTPHTASNTLEFVTAGFNDILKVIEGLENGHA